MISVTNAVQQVVENSEFARKSLRLGLLNISAYAKLIHPRVEEITKKEIKNHSSIIMALSRYGRQLQSDTDTDRHLQIKNLVSRTHLEEIAFTKTHDIQERLATLNLLESIRNAPFFVSTVGLSEVTIVTDASLADVVRGHFGSSQPLARRGPLASLTIQAHIETNLSTQSYRVLEQLAVRKINIIECVTSPTELTIILNENDVSKAFQILHSQFLKK